MIRSVTDAAQGGHCGRRDAVGRFLQRKSNLESSTDGASTPLTASIAAQGDASILRVRTRLSSSGLLDRRNQDKTKSGKLFLSNHDDKHMQFEVNLVYFLLLFVFTTCQSESSSITSMVLPLELGMTGSATSLTLTPLFKGS